MVTAMKEKNKLTVVRVKLVEDIPLYSDKIVGSPDDAIDILKEELSTYDREVFGIINLNTKGKVLNFNIVSVGTLNSAEAHPRETLKTAILSNAASFIAEQLDEYIEDALNFKEEVNRDNFSLCNNDEELEF